MRQQQEKGKAAQSLGPTIMGEGDDGLSDDDEPLIVESGGGGGGGGGGDVDDPEGGGALVRDMLVRSIVRSIHTRIFPSRDVRPETPAGGVKKRRKKKTRVVHGFRGNDEDGTS